MKGLKTPAMVDLTVSIVSHGHRSYLEECLTSVEEAAKGISTEVHLVANLPGDGSAELAREKFPRVAISVNDRRHGFSTNHNRIYRQTASRYFLLLNPDTRIEGNALATLVDFMDRHPDAFACGPKLLYPDRRLQYSCRRFPTPIVTLVRRTPLRRLPGARPIIRDHSLEDWDHGSVREVDWVFGACLMVRRSAMERVGLLDEKLYLFCEDIDWCYRMKKEGGKVYYVPDAVVVHDLSDEIYEPYLSRHRLLHYRSMLHYAWKHMIRGG